MKIKIFLISLFAIACIGAIVGILFVGRILLTIRSTQVAPIPQSLRIVNNTGSTIYFCCRHRGRLIFHGTGTHEFVVDIADGQDVYSLPASESAAIEWDSFPGTPRTNIRMLGQIISLSQDSDLVVMVVTVNRQSVNKKAVLPVRPSWTVFANGGNAEFVDIQNNILVRRMP